MRASSWSRDRLGSTKMASYITYEMISVRHAGEGVFMVKGQAGGQVDGQLQHLWDDLSEASCFEGVLLVQGQVEGQEDGHVQHLVDILGEEAGEGALLVQGQTGIQEDGQPVAPVELALVKSNRTHP